MARKATAQTKVVNTIPEDQLLGPLDVGGSSFVTHAHRRCLERWYKLKDHPVQYALVNDDKRVKVVPAGRRSGKSERFKRYISREAMRKPGPYFVAAPTRDQVRRIYWDDLKLLCFEGIFTEARESDLVLKFPNGSTITLIGLDQPKRIEGVFWAGGGIDEIADTRPKAWTLNIAPALDTFNPLDPDHKPWVWLLGVPDGFNHYYDLAEYARSGVDPEWGLYEWHSADILPPDLIAAAKRRMSAQQFRQEYEASFETAQGRVYSDFSVKANATNEKIKPHEQLMWMHDFNYTPMSSAIGVRRGNSLYILDEIVLTSAVARQSAIEFLDRYADHANKSLLLYGDPAGRAGEKHGQSSNYTEIEELLRTNGWQVERRVKLSAPAIRDRQNSVRAKVANAAGERTLFVNPACTYATKGMSTVQLKEGSSFLEDESDYQHITTAIGYCVDYEWPVRPVEEVPDTSRIIVPNISHLIRGAR